MPHIQFSQVGEYTNPLNIIVNVRVNPVMNDQVPLAIVGRIGGARPPVLDMKEREAHRKMCNKREVEWNIHAYTVELFVRKMKCFTPHVAPGM